MEYDKGQWAYNVFQCAAELILRVRVGVRNAARVRPGAGTKTGSGCCVSSKGQRCPHGVYSDLPTSLLNHNTVSPKHSIIPKHGTLLAAYMRGGI